MRRTAVRRSALLVVAGVALAASVIAAPPAAACSCRSPAAALDVAEAEAVFLAEPVTSRLVAEAGPVEWTMAVHEVLVGDVDVITEVRTGLGGGDCGRDFEVGTEVAVVAYADDDGTLGTGICSSTDAGALRAAAVGAGHEPHLPAGAPVTGAVAADGGPTLVPTPVEDPVEDELSLIRALAALVSVLIAMALVSALTRGDDEV